MSRFVPLAIVLLLAAALLRPAAPARAEWSARLQGNYESARFGQTEMENAYVDILARQTLRFGGANTLLIGLRLRRDDDLTAESHMVTGQVDAELRTPTVGLYLRHRPSQRPNLYSPGDWRREDTVYGGSLGLEGLPQLFFEETRRQRQEPGYGPTRTESFDRRFRTSWLVAGFSLDYMFRRTESASRADTAAVEPKTTRTGTDHAGGVDWSASLRRNLSIGAGYRAGDTRYERTAGREQRSRYQRAESDLSYRAWRPLLLSGNASWQETRSRVGAEDWRDSRVVDFFGSAMVTPTRHLDLSFIRAYQEYRNEGQAPVPVDYAQVQARAGGRLLPEMTVNASASRNWTLSRNEGSTPANQAILGVTGELRPDMQVAYTLTGQALDDVPRNLRYQVSQDLELRLRPAPPVRLIGSIRTYRLGGELSLRHPDRIYYRAEALVTAEGGGSASAHYTSQQVRDLASPAKYTLGGSASLPWRRLVLSGTGSASRSAGSVAATGRPWGFSATANSRLRVQRRTDFTVSFTRNLPAVGSGSSIWQATIVQRLR